MKLFTFGDSWTEGVGGNLEEELQTDAPEDRTKIRHKYCWPKYLSDTLDAELQNFGMGGSSNKNIFDLVSQLIHNQTINKDDLVVVMWSSSLRDEVPFFPTENLWHFWGEKYMNKSHIYKSALSNKKTSDYDLHKNLKCEYQEYFIDNLFTDVYYNIINQNYILYLQYMFEKIGIRYLFCDAFDIMIKNDYLVSIDKTDLINKNHYWGFIDKTFKEYLIEKNRKDVWEDGNLWLDTVVGKHPNKNGYQLISDELYRFIKENNILNYKTKQIEKRII